MKILGLIASPRGEESRTLRLVRSVMQGAQLEGAETEIVDIYSLHIEYCTACGSCYARGECTFIDDYPELLEMMMNAEGIVLGSPNYIDSVTAPLKAVFDRMADAIHCQMLIGKYGCSVCTAGGSGQDEVVAYMNHVLNAVGAIAVGGVGVALGRDPSAIITAEKDALALGRKLVQSIRGELFFPEQQEALLQRQQYFSNLVSFNRDVWTHEYDWHIRMGWIKGNGKR